VLVLTVIAMCFVYSVTLVCVKARPTLFQNELYVLSARLRYLGALV